MEELPLDDREKINPPPQKGLDLRWLLRTAKRKALLITSITSLAAAGAWYLSPKYPPIYSGNFQLLVEPVTSAEKLSDPSTLTRTGGVPNEGLLSLDYPTVIQILTSPQMLSQVAEQIKAEYPNLSINAAQIRKGLLIERIGGANRFQQTKILKVSYEGTNPKIVELVLKKTADKYLNYSLAERKSRIGEGVKFIDQQLPGLYKRVASLQKELQKIQEQNGTINTAGKGEELFEKVRTIEGQLLETRRELQELTTLRENLQKQLKLTLDEAIVASTLSQDPNYQKLLANLKEIETTIAVESARFQPDSPNIQTLEVKRQNLLDLLNQETKKILGQDIKTATSSNSAVLILQNSIRLGMINKLTETTNQIQVLEVRNQELEKNKKYFQQQAQIFPDLVRRYNDIQRNLEISNQTLNRLLTQRETLRVEAAQSQVPWEIVSQPQLLRDPAGNVIATPIDSKKTLIMGVAGGLLLGLVTAILLEKSRNIFYTTEDLKDAVPLPLLGAIPVDDSLISDNSTKWENSTSATESLEDWYERTRGNNKNGSPFQEAFTNLYANIRFCFWESPIRSLAVCSAESGEGKSTIALHLAQTAAATGQRVLLVDANFRVLVDANSDLVPIHTSLRLPNIKGLSNLLSHKLDPEDIIQRSPLADNLFVLTSGSLLADSSILLASDRMQELMEKFMMKFDLVIYDTSDILSFVDASFVAAHVDGILMVATVGKTKQSALMQALNQIKTFNLPTLGVVANQAFS